MKIGILGSGEVGQVLGAGFAKHGHTVMLGTRDPKQEKVQAWVSKTGKGASAGTFAETAAFGETVLLVTNWAGTESAIGLAGPSNLAGKIVIDVTNPLDFSGGVPPKLAVGYTDSGGEAVQRWLPQSRVVKAFNIVGNPHMVDPSFPGGPPTMFFCGNDEGAKKTVAGLLESFGWDAADIGGIEAARYLEPLAMVWMAYFFKTGNGNHALKLLKK